MFSSKSKSTRECMVCAALARAPLSRAMPRSIHPSIRLASAAGRARPLEISISSRPRTRALRHHACLIIPAPPTWGLGTHPRPPSVSEPARSPRGFVRLRSTARPRRAPLSYVPNKGERRAVGPRRAPVRTESGGFCAKGLPSRVTRPAGSGSGAGRFRWIDPANPPLLFVR